MALDFAARIHALTGFDADSTDDTETGDDFDEAAAQFMTDAAKEIINILPPKLKEKCLTESTITNSPSYLADLDGIGEIMYVTRLSANSGGFRIPCREVPSAFGEMSGDSTSIYFASATDPAYWVTSSNDAMILNVNPTPTADQTAIVYHVGYPTFTAGDSGTYDVTAVTSIANFPDEAEHLVVLRAAISAAQYLLAIEEDPELYVPIISSLKAQYQDAIQGLITAGVTAPQKGAN